MHLGTVIRNLREKQSLSQADLAERLGVTQGYISQVERSAGANIRLSTLNSIAEALNSTAPELVSAAEAQPLPTTPTTPTPADAPAEAVAS